MKRWPAAHAAVAVCAVTSWVTGYVPAGAVHAWLAATALPLVGWLAWVGGRFLLRVRRNAVGRQLNAVFARLLFALLLVAALTGVWAAGADDSLTRLRALRWHEVSADLLLPTLLAHSLLSLGMRWARRRASG